MSLILNIFISLLMVTQELDLSLIFLTKNFFLGIVSHTTQSCNPQLPVFLASIPAFGECFLSISSVTDILNNNPVYENINADCFYFVYKNAFRFINFMLKISFWRTIGNIINIENNHIIRLKHVKSYFVDSVVNFFFLFFSQNELNTSNRCGNNREELSCW